MRRPFFLCMLILGLQSSLSARQTTNASLVDYGYVTKDWVYINDSLGISFPLPKDAYFMNSLSKPATYVRIGSPVKSIEGYTEPVRLPLSDFQGVHVASIATLFSFSYLPKDTSAVVKKPLDYNADKTFYFGLTMADKRTDRDYLRQSCLACTDSSFHEVFFPDVMVGNTFFNGYITGVRDLKGNAVGHFFGVKRMGPFYLVLQYYFSTIEQFDEYKKALRKLVVGK
jgi:hypothetical protein